MHVVLVALGLVVTILVLLSRLADAGISLGGLNPFLWRRRRAWRNRVRGNPLFAIRDPQELAAVLVVGVAKIDGDMSAEEKQAVLREFEQTFSLKPREASDLLGSSVYLLRDARILQTQLDEVTAPAHEALTSDQAASIVAMMERVASASGSPSGHQRDLIDSARARLLPPPPSGKTW